MTRWRLLVSGIVQGVGFRPFVYRLARRHNLAGLVRNSPAGVEVEIEGPAPALAAFAAALASECPPAAVIEEVEQAAIPPQQSAAFIIEASNAGGPPLAGVSPDLAVCPDCLQEMLDPADRRYLYPFINCTNCGPRYTIIEAIPYDRPHTTMRAFTMCPSCQAEYDDPASRRFHAQPNACPACGPRLRLVPLQEPGPDAGNPADAALPRSTWAEGAEAPEPGRRLDQRAAVAAARRLLRSGGILAVKGIGGFHLAVNAADDEAVRRLRRRKGRAAKPLALMVRDLATARGLVRLTAEEERLLTSPARPIVLAPKIAAEPGPAGTAPPLAAPAVAPGHQRLGLMLAYAPLHYLLLADDLPVLVMTSANRSAEPICIADDEARRRLAGIADALLLHDRQISRGNDDSVVMGLAGLPAPAGIPGSTGHLMIRRGRGYAPGLLPVATGGAAVLAVGAELKNTVCLAAAGRGVLSQHIGDLQNLESYRVFDRTIHDLAALFAIRPQVVAHDLHPDYLSSRWAREWAQAEGLPHLAVQHHHAHLASCLAENRHPGPAIGLILDGTGYGPDHTIWGGEILIGDGAGYRRYGHLETMPLPGGDAAVAQPWRAGLAYLHQAFGGELPDLPFLAGLGDPALTGGVGGGRAAVVAMLERRLNSPLTSSCGRLFDAVAAISGGPGIISYEAQAAIELMQAGGGMAAPAFTYGIEEQGEGIVLGIRPLVRDVAAAVAAGADLAMISRRFHYTLVKMFTAAVQRAAAASGIKTVVLSGGVMQNEILLVGLGQALTAAGCEVLLPRRLPPNDGCISFGQAVIALNFAQHGKQTQP